MGVPLSLSAHRDSVYSSLWSAAISDTPLGKERTTKRARTISAAFVRTVSRPNVYGDGRGGRRLSLRAHRTVTGRITKTGRQRVRIEERLTSTGLGPYAEITLAKARRKALDNSRAVRHGGNPRGRGVPAFAEAAERTIELHRGGWKAGSEKWRARQDPELQRSYQQREDVPCTCHSHDSAGSAADCRD